MRLRHFAFAAVLLCVMGGVAQGQVQTGMQPFGSFGGSPEAINLGNLNAHWVIPVRNKAGRGTPFTYDLSYDSSVWYPVTVSGVTSWQPMPNWGWTAQTAGATGFVTYYGLTSKCNATEYQYVYTDWVYYDSLGAAHVFPGEITYDQCDNEWSNGIAAVATDGSGYTLNVAAELNATITSRGGRLIAPPVYISGGTAQVTDRNGNVILAGGSFTDTLGDNVLSVGGAGTPASPTTLSYTAPSGGTATYTVKYSAYTVQTNFGCAIADYPATAQNLVSEIDLPDGSKYSFSYEVTPGHPGSVTARPASVTLPTGGTISYTYTGGSNGIECGDGSTAGLTRQTPDGTWAYSRTGSNPFWVTSVLDASNMLTNLEFTVPTGSNQFIEVRRDVYNGPTTSASHLSDAVECPNGIGSSCDHTAFSLPLTERDVWAQLNGSAYKVTDTLYNSYGLTTEKDEYDFWTPSGQPLLRKTITTYASLGNGIYSMPSEVKVTDGSGNVKQDTTYAYDHTAVFATSGTPQHAAVTGSRGNLTTLSQWVSGSSWLTKTFTYYDTGNIQTATDVNGAQTTYNYPNTTSTCGNAFPTSVSEPLGLTRSMTWNCTGAVQLTATDENGQTVTNTYNDPYFWRVNAVTDQESNMKSYSYTPDPSYPAAFSAAQTLTFNGGNSISSDIQYEDSLGRAYTDQHLQSPTSSNLDTVSYAWDANGRPSSASLPCTIGYMGTCSTAKTTQTYDALNRKLVTTDGGSGTVSFTYNQNDTLRAVGPAPTGENTKQRQFEKDALGRLSSVCEITGATGSGTCGQTNSQTGYWTKYAYDLLNDLTGVTQNAQASAGQQQTRSYAYDGLKRMTSETNAENGTTSYVYDTDGTCGTSDGDLVKKTDSMGNVTCYAYDALHRMTSTTYSGPYQSVTPNRYFVYDAATVDSAAMANAKTRLAEAYTATCSTCTKITDLGFGYSARGEISDEYETAPNTGGYYHANLTYWPTGAPEQLSGLASLPTLTYGVDGEGRMNAVSASAGQNPVTAVSFNAASLATSLTLGSGDGDTYQYDANTDRMTQYSFNVNGQSLVGNLTWNANGSLAEQNTTDPFYSGDTQNCAYTHDDLSRVASVNCGSVWAQTFGYDAFGNITKSGSMSFAPTYAAATNRMATLPGSTPTYDGDGNVTNDGANTYGWDANGNVVTVNSTTSTFDALGRLAAQSWPGEVLWLPGGLGRIFWSGQVAEVAMLNLPGGARVVYNEKSGTEEYEHSDHLGSGRLVSDTGRNYLYSMAYAPYGETYAQSKFEAGLFTGMGESFNVGLYDSQTREYSDAGRWVSPDPAGMAAVRLRDPQTWNRYAYVRNNPMNMTDIGGLCPSGYDACAPLQSPNYFYYGSCAMEGALMGCVDAQETARDECDADYCGDEGGGEEGPDPIQPDPIEPSDPNQNVGGYDNICDNPLIDCFNPIPDLTVPDTGMGQTPQTQATCQAQYEQSVSAAGSTATNQFLVFFTAVGVTGDIGLIGCLGTGEFAPLCMEGVELALGGPSIVGAVAFVHQYNTTVNAAKTQLQACQSQ